MHLYLYAGDSISLKAWSTCSAGH